MTVLTYICLIVGAWQLACGVLRLVDKLEGRGGYAAAASIRDRKAHQQRAVEDAGPYKRKRSVK